MVKVLGVQEPYADTIIKKWGHPWENFLLESDKMLMEDSDFLLCEKGGKIFFEADRLISEDVFQLHLEAGRAEFLRWEKIRFLFLETGGKIVLNYPYAHSSFGIYQRAHCREGKISTRRHFYIPYTDATPARSIMRKKYYDGVGAWNLLTAEEKAVYNKNAVGRHMSGYNLFIKKFMKT